jgi:ubiquinone/menaquinone biosynthesis C-methylase UbiE
MWHVLEHVPNLDNQIKELKRLLKPSGFNRSGSKSSMQNITERFGLMMCRFIWHFSKKAIKCLKRRHAIRKVFHEI